MYIDELGTANVDDKNSSLYILAGCSINESERQHMKIWADKIKFKYWGHKNIVFHSREIWRKENDFEIFKDNKILKQFLKDLKEFLALSKFKMFFVIIDKEKAKIQAWNNVKIYKVTSKQLIKNFIAILLSGDSRGKIIVESATAEKDFYFHKALGHFLAEGIKEIGVDYKKVQETVTSISFVTKNNFDIEEQIADLFAYAAKCKYLGQIGKRVKNGSYEKMMLELLENKTFKNPRKARDLKRKYFKEVDSFVVLPQ